MSRFFESDFFEPPHIIRPTRHRYNLRGDAAQARSDCGGWRRRIALASTTPKGCPSQLRRVKSLATGIYALTPATSCRNVGSRIDSAGLPPWPREMETA